VWKFRFNSTVEMVKLAILFPLALVSVWAMGQYTGAILQWAVAMVTVASNMMLLLLTGR